MPIPATLTPLPGEKRPIRGELLNAVVVGIRYVNVLAPIHRGAQRRAELPVSDTKPAKGSQKYAAQVEHLYPVTACITNIYAILTDRNGARALRHPYLVSPWLQKNKGLLIQRCIPGCEHRPYVYDENRPNTLLKAVIGRRHT